MNYCQSLFSLAEPYLSKTAFLEVETGRKLTFGQLRAGVERWSVALRERGIRPGDAVAIHLLNGIDFILAHMGAQHVGAVSCLIDPLTQPRSLPYFLEKTRAKMLFTQLSAATLAEFAMSAVEIVSPAAFDEEARSLEGLRSVAPMHAWEPSSTCYVYFTSGTTNTPKGVPLTQASHANFFRIAERYWRPSGEDARHIGFVPFSHGFGSIFLIPWTIRTRSELHIMRSFHPARVLETIVNAGITHMYGVPSHYQQLLRLPRTPDALSTVRMAFCAAAKLDIGTIESWKAATGAVLHEGYGLIETDAGIVWRVHEESRGTGHVGECPDPDLVEVAIFDEDGRRLAADEEGEICVRGASVMAGYLDMPEENARTFRDGWFRTGDKGFLAADRHLFMTGRIKDIINIAGLKISPFEVEAVLNTHPDVADSVVVPAEDALYGEVVKAYIVAKGGAAPTERDIVRFAARQLINFQVPKQVEFLDAFPLNSMGKVDRKALQAR